MTEPYDDDTYDEQDDEQPRHVTLSRDQIRSLERDAKEARQLRSQIAEMQRAQVLSGLGVDLTDRQSKALLATVEGDLTVEAARAAAEELGFIKPAPTSEAAAEAAALDRMSEASNGTSADPANDDPVARLHRAFEQGGPDAVKAQIEKDGGSLVSWA